MAGVTAFMTLSWHWFAAFAVFVACIPLFAWNHQFFGDWPNHLAMIGYFGEYMRAHAALPETFHTSGAVGRATPIFYGSLYLPALGALSAVVGPRVALTIAVALLLLLQFASVRELFRDVARDEAVACAAAIIVTWAIYPLTDLYNRGAIPEFFAITALQTGSCLWALYTRDPARRTRAGFGAGLLVTFAAGVHPPTALFGGLTFGVLWLACFFWCPDRARVLRTSLVVVAAAAGVLAPWLYVIARFGGQLNIVRSKSPLAFYPKSLDALATRLSAVPTVGPDPNAVGTPNLDPQISVPIGAAVILLSVVALWARARDRQANRALAFAAVCVTASATLFLLSTCSPAWRAVPESFTIIQYAYRLVAFVNLAALGALAGVLAALPHDHGNIASSRLVVAAGVVVATVAVGVKLPRCLEGGSGAGAAVTDYANPPYDWYFGADDYTTPDAFAKLDGAAPKQAVRLPVGPPDGFGMVGARQVRADVRTQVTTNVAAFPWNGLTVDGRSVPREATLADGFKLATWIEAGAHDIGYRFRPDPAWLALRAFSLGLFGLWVTGLALGPAVAGARSSGQNGAGEARRSRSRASSPRPPQEEACAQVPPSQIT